LIAVVVLPIVANGFPLAHRSLASGAIADVVGGIGIAVIAGSAVAVGVLAIGLLITIVVLTIVADTFGLPACAQAHRAVAGVIAGGGIAVVAGFPVAVGIKTIDLLIAIVVQAIVANGFARSCHSLAHRAVAFVVACGRVVVVTVLAIAVGILAIGLLIAVVVHAIATNAFALTHRTLAHRAVADVVGGSGVSVVAGLAVAVGILTIDFLVAVIVQGIVARALHALRRIAAHVVGALLIARTIHIQVATRIAI
jgi:hypothetical protein